MFEYAATVVSVTDGDTIKLNVDLGFHVTVTESFRLFGINAPEHGTPAGDVATAYLKGALPVGSAVTVKSEKPKAIHTEKYGRWLGIVFLGDSQTAVNDDLVATGHALPWDGKGARPV
jgi:endonuclease YncB( thermonuclease family)